MPDKWRVLNRWFLEVKRDLPWRDNPSPYAVWISEVMLQQTQVATVIPYFERWMERFPSVAALAEASMEEVLKMWEGLGYYRRARHLHGAAKIIVERWKGEFPSTEESLRTLPGMGPYTVGAVLSFAFKQRRAAVDGNVIRVLTRFFGIEDDISLSRTEKKIREIAEKELPNEAPWVVTEAWIELGALICKKQPLCFSCPLREGCVAFKKGKTSDIPFKSRKTSVTKLERHVALIRNRQRFLVRQVPEGEVMEGLHEFPYFDKAHDLKKKISERWSVEVQEVESLKAIKHGFTRFEAKLFPVLLESEPFEPGERFFWGSLTEISQLPFSSGHRRILEELNRKFAS